MGDGICWWLKPAVVCVLQAIACCFVSTMPVPTPALPSNPPRPLPGTTVSEDQRAQAYWDAPFALLVQDDSPEMLMEYANG